MVRLIIAVIIVVICTYLGVSKSRKFESRERILREAIFLFKGLESEIKYALTALPNAIEAARQNMNTYLKDVLGVIVLNMLSGNSSSYSLSLEIDKIIELTTYDKQIISQGLGMLGNSDVDGEMGIIQLTIANLEIQLEEAIEYKRKNSKMYKTIGMATGLMIAIVFI